MTHELSVPAVTAMLLSALAFATAAWAGLALADALSPRARAGLQALAALAALAATVAVRRALLICEGQLRICMAKGGVGDIQALAARAALAATVAECRALES